MLPRDTSVTVPISSFSLFTVSSRFSHARRGNICMIGAESETAEIPCTFEQT
jgi:hypothetical protein